jgi:hypothetical protein
MQVFLIMGINDNGPVTGKSRRSFTGFEMSRDSSSQRKGVVKDFLEDVVRERRKAGEFQGISRKFSRK